MADVNAGTPAAPSAAPLVAALPIAPMARARRLALVLAVTAAYGNHFCNGFHFDDFHTIVDNPAIRGLDHLGSFFTDGRTFSVLAENQGWRPWVSTTLTLDYALGGGYRPFWFHLSTFAAFIALIVVVNVLAAHLFERARPRDAGNGAAAIFTAGVFGLHPVAAETMNYIIQRADLYVALGLVSAVALFACRPAWRRSGLFLLPFGLAAASKPTALVFPVLVLAYLRVFDPGTWRRDLLRVLPAGVAAVVLALVHGLMTPPSYTYGGADPYGYRITQPYVALHTARMFFWPTALSADSDMEAARTLLEPRVLLGFGFMAVLIVAVVVCARRPITRPVSFGIAWFVITMLPTSLAPLAEVTNDHRMFLPLVGLAIAVCWAAALLTSAWPLRRRRLAALALLLVLGVSTHVRNRVWATEQSLWADVVVKSPRNGRGWMNYGLTFMAVGRYAEALRCFEQGARFTPRYSYLEINQGIAHGQLPGHETEAERHFQRALELDVRSARPLYWYARWLRQQGRVEEARMRLRAALGRSATDLYTRRLVTEMLTDMRNGGGESLSPPPSRRRVVPSGPR